MGGLPLGTQNGVVNRSVKTQLQTGPKVKSCVRFFILLPFYNRRASKLQQKSLFVYFLIFSPK